MHYDDIISQYNGQVSELTAKYESLRFEDVHLHLIPYLPEFPATILDLGCGTGRDAAWLAERGYDVVAVEPSTLMLEAAKRIHPHSRICWLQDSMPDLKKTLRLGMSFDVIMLSAVWMHIAPEDRARVFRKLVTLLKPNGIVSLSLRHGPQNVGQVFPVSSLELEKLAIQRGLTFKHLGSSGDKLEREGVVWENVLLQFPDDGTGALPLLRHVIINDSKSSTYKLALLRTLVRIADSASGVASIEDDHVSVPLGLVALYWIRLYKPLIENRVPQMPANKDDRGPAFVGKAFSALAPISPFELRIGGEFYGLSGSTLTEAIKDSAQTIRKMPAFYITYPNTTEQVFKVTGKIKPARSVDRLTITPEYLASFGEFQVPLALWRAFSRYAAWIEPALLYEWTELMRQYSESHGQAFSAFQLMDHLRWLDPDRDTSLVRGLVERRLQAGHAFDCVWSGKPLKTDRFDIDHCFPFAAWPCNDLWNLLPANRDVNLRKKDKLVSIKGLLEARERIENFWTDTYFAQPISYEQRFRREALASLPVLECENEGFFDSMFDALQLKRMSLKHDHNLTDWC